VSEGPWQARSKLAAVFQETKVRWADLGRRRDALFLIVLCVTEAVVLWRTSPEFFDGDAFFYFANPVTDLWKTLTSADTSGVYRPLGSLAVSFLFQPLFGLNHSLYSATALVAHVVNTVLAFLVLDGLLEQRIAVRAATVFFGLNPVAIYVTHSFSFLADFSYAFFCLLAVLAFLRHCRTRGRGTFALTVGCFVLALLSKELAVTLPALLLVLCLTFLRNQKSREFHEKAAQRLLRALFAVLVAYLAFYSTLKGGRFYDSTPGRNYFPEFTPLTLFSKVEYFMGAAFLPVAEKLGGGPALEDPHRLVYLAAPVVAGFLVFLLWPPSGLAWRTRGGLLWTLLAASPVLFINPAEVTHNLYLPALGLALAFGLFWEHVARFALQSGWLRPSLLHIYGLGVALFSLHVNQDIFLDANWRPRWEQVARIWVTEVRSRFPELRPPTQVFVIKSNESDRWDLYSGELIRAFMGQPDLTFIFDDDGAPFPLEAARRGEAIALILLDGHVHDVTASLIGEAEREAIPRPSLVRQLDHGQVALLSGRALDSVRFETPTGGPAFAAPILMGTDYRPALVTLSGTRVRFGVFVSGAARLQFGLAKRFEIGDGVVARVFFEGEGGRRLLFERRLDPRDVPEDRRWFDVTLDLAAYKGQLGTLELECTPGPAGDYVADWLGWSGLFLEGARPL
jgi:hypothetical protein